MNSLNLSLKRFDDNSAEFFATVKCNGFEGLGSCFVDVDAFAISAQNFSLYPLPKDGSVCIEGGYFNKDMRGLAQTHLRLSAMPADALGGLVLRLTLATPVEESSRSFSAKLNCDIPCTYETLKNVSEALMALAKQYGDSYIIDL